MNKHFSFKCDSGSNQYLEISFQAYSKKTSEHASRLTTKNMYLSKHWKNCQNRMHSIQTLLIDISYMNNSEMIMKIPFSVIIDKLFLIWIHLIF